jgi:hypothetical protein
VYLVIQGFRRRKKHRDVGQATRGIYRRIFPKGSRFALGTRAVADQIFVFDSQEKSLVRRTYAVWNFHSYPVRLHLDSQQR